MDGGETVKPEFSKAWRRQIAANLPGRLTPEHREALTTWIEDSIRRWLEVKPEIAPHREKLKQLAAAADKANRRPIDAHRSSARLIAHTSAIRAHYSMDARAALFNDPPAQLGGDGILRRNMNREAGVPCVTAEFGPT